MSRVKNSAFIIGCRASGKTSFLTGLCILSRPGKRSPFSMITNDERSARYVSDLKRIADNGDWPPPNADMVPLDFEVIFKHRSFPLSLLDYPGEDLLDAMETMNYENKEQIEQHICAAEIILVLLDPTQDMISPINTNPERTRRRQDALAMAIGKLAAIRTDAGLPLPIMGLLITKADLVENDQMEALKADNAVLMNKLAHCARAQKLTCFPLSASGPISVTQNSDAKSTQYPEDPNPKGYEAVFNWLGLKLDLCRYRRLILVAGAVLLAVAIGFAGFVFFRSASERNLAELIERENVEIISELLNKPKIPRRVATALDNRGAKEYDRLEARSEEVQYLEQIIELADESESWSKVPYLANRSQFEELSSALKTREDNVRFRAIENANRVSDDEQTLQLIAKYLARFPTGGHNTTQILEIQENVLGEAESRLRSEIRAIPITSRDSLSTKTAKISEYLSRFPSAVNHQSIRVARDLAARLASTDSIRIVLKSCGYEGFEKERKHEVRWFVRNALLPNATHASSGRLQRSTAQNHLLDIRSSDWGNIRTDFYIENWIWQLTKASEIEISLLHDIHRFNGNNRIAFNERTEKWKEVDTWMVAEVHVPASGGTGFEQIRRDQLQAYADYIYPGSRW